MKSVRIPIRLESRRLDDGSGGLFLNEKLIETYPTESESDSVALAILRHMAVDGLLTNVKVHKDEQPIDLFDMNIR